MILFLTGAWSWFSNSTVGKWIIIAVAAVGAVLIYGRFKKNEGARDERSENNDKAIKSTEDANKIRDGVDQSPNAVRDDPDNRRNAG